MDVMTILSEYDNRKQAIFKVYDLMMDNVSVNEAGEASAEETLQAIDWCYRMEDELKKWFHDQIHTYMEAQA